jgi:hypothetical protein
MACRFTQRKAHRHRMNATRPARQANEKYRALLLLNGKRVRPEKLSRAELDLMVVGSLIKDDVFNLLHKKIVGL